MRTYCAHPGETLEGATGRALLLAREHDTVALIYGVSSCVVTGDMSHQTAVALMKASTKLHLGYHRMMSAEALSDMSPEQRRRFVEGLKANIERRQP